STVGTTNELFEGAPNYPLSRFPAGPYGLGVRVPMIVISPWTKGGWVDSQVFDHTSLIRFVERRFGVLEPNIRAARRWRSKRFGHATFLSEHRPSRSGLSSTVGRRADGAVDLHGRRSRPSVRPLGGHPLFLRLGGVRPERLPAHFRGQPWGGQCQAHGQDQLRPEFGRCRPGDSKPGLKRRESERL